MRRDSLGRKERNNNIDFLRGVAFIAVVLGIIINESYKFVRRLLSKKDLKII